VSERVFRRIAAVSAAAVGLLSIVYAIAYLVITPSAQRGADVAAFMRSYLADPTGLRLASVCLAVSGIASAAGLVAVVERLARRVDAERRGRVLVPLAAVAP